MEHCVRPARSPREAHQFNMVAEQAGAPNPTPSQQFTDCHWHGSQKTATIESSRLALLAKQMNDSFLLHKDKRPQATTDVNLCGSAFDPIVRSAECYISLRLCRTVVCGDIAPHFEIAAKLRSLAKTSDGASAGHLENDAREGKVCGLQHVGQFPAPPGPANRRTTSGKDLANLVHMC